MAKILRDTAPATKSDVPNQVDISKYYQPHEKWHSNITIFFACHEKLHSNTTRQPLKVTLQQ